MAELTFGCTEAHATRYAATPTLSFTLHITESTDVRVHAIALRCQIRIEPHRRRYSPDEARRLNDLFGDTSRWAETVKPIQLATVTTMVPGFTSVTETELPGAVHLRPRGRVGPLPAGARRRHDPAAAAVQRHGVHRLPGLDAGRADPVELRGFLPDAGDRLAGRGERALPWQRLAALLKGDPGRAVRVQGRPTRCRPGTPHCPPCSQPPASRRPALRRAGAAPAAPAANSRSGAS